MRSSLRRVAHRVDTLVSGLVVQEWRAHRRFEEHYIGRLLEYLHVDCVLDVGANIGQYAMMLREYSGYRGTIISFEPSPGTLDILRQNSAGDPLWHVEAVALGNTTGTARFRTIPKASVGNSFLPMLPEDAGGLQFEEVEVPVARLADVLPKLLEKYKCSRPFLKMDTQGFDLEVFAGAKEVLPSIIGLQSELSVAPFYENAPGWLEALETYRQAGFELSTLFANNTDWFPHLREIDCVMYRPEQK